MKIAFATIFDPQDVRRGSGTFYHLCKEIERQEHTVHYIGPLDIQFPLPTRALRFISRRLLRKGYRSYRDVFSARRLGDAVAQQLDGVDYDVLLTNDYGIAGYTPTDRPVVIYTDAMFPPDYSENINPRLAGLSSVSAWMCQRVLREGLERAALLVFPAEWIKEEAVQGYGISPEKITLAPFGANVEDPTREVATQRNLTGKPLRLLFVGKDWARKGGTVVVELAQVLRARGVDVMLHLVGGTPPIDVDSDYVVVHGLLDKSDPAQREELYGLYRMCDVFVLPSMAEGFVISVLEAAAFGMPTLAYDTEGVSEPVQHGETGALLPLNAPAEDFAEVILEWLADPAEYNRLVHGARQFFESTANWQSAVSQLLAAIEARVDPAPFLS